MPITDSFIKEFFTIIPNHIDMTKKSELYSVNDFTFAVAVILSAQATDKKVNEITPKLFALADSPEKMVALGEDGIKEIIKVISFFNNKAKNIIEMSKTLIEKHKGVLPNSHEELIKLAGIGQKTANVIENVLWGKATIGVDTHVFRLAHRFGWVDDSDNTPEKTEEKLKKVIPEKYWGIINHTMVIHGRYTCVARKPKCENCPLKDKCPFLS